MSSSSTDDPQAGGKPNDQYVVVARRYRPKDFGELVGQNHVAQGLQKAIDTKRVGHAYLFTGARGVGKTSTARILAKALNCQHGPTPQPCGKCDICLSITAGDDIDVLEIDGASNRGIDEVRQLRSNVNIRPSRAHYKIYIIDEVHMLTTQAFNALLKTLEEPPEHVKFIFCTTEPEKIPITVLSRCQKFDFAPVGAEAINQRLRDIATKENVEIDDEALATIARRAGGSVRDSQSLLEQLLSLGRERISLDDVHDMLGTARTERLMGILARMAEHDAAGALAELDKALGEGVDCGQLAEQLLGAWRDLMAVSVGAPPEILGTLGPADVEELKRLGGELGVETVLAAVQILDEALVRMRQNPNVRIVLETALVRVARLADMQMLAQLIDQLQSGGPLPSSAAGKKKHEVSAAPASPPATAGPAARAPQRSSAPPAAGGPSGGGASYRPAAEPAHASGGVATEPRTAARQALTAQSIDAVWKEALASLNDMTSDMAAQAESLELLGAGRLRVTFPGNGESYKSFCEMPQRKAQLEGAVREVTGETVSLEFALGELREEVAVSRPAAAEHNPRVLRREAMNHPLVEEVRQLFDADIVDVKARGNS